MDAAELLLAESELLALLEPPADDDPALALALPPADSDAAAGSSGSGSETSSAKRRRVTPAKRKPTYYARKEEKEALEQQLHELQAQVRALAGERVEAQTLARRHTLQGACDANRVLRDAVSEQQFAFATIQSAMAKQVHSQSRLPFYAPIRLGKDAAERRAALAAAKDALLRDGLQYVVERTRFFEPAAAFAEVSRFSTARGDFCALICDTTPLEGVTSVRQVFDALQFFLLNMEISVSELLGVLTLREDSGEKHQGTFQSRLVSDVGSGVQVELNFATFCQMFGPSSELGGGREFGVIVVEAVEEDEVFPYVPVSRLRLDVSAAMTVTLQARPRASTATTGGGLAGEEELVAVVTRTCLLSLRRPEQAVPPHVMRAVRDGIERWGDAMIKKVREIVHQSHADGGGGVPIAARQMTELEVCELLDGVVSELT